MPDVRPFPGLRFDPAAVGDWGSILSPPYDIISDDEARALKARSPWQIARVETAAGGTELAQAAGLLRQWRGDGALIQDEPSLYIHEHRFRDETAGAERVRTALFAAVALGPWAESGVFPHEHTMPGPKAARTALRDAANADISPLMVVTPDRSGAYAALLGAERGGPVAEGEDAAGDRHRLWRIPAGPARQAAAALAAEPLYMADGHHRYEAALESASPDGAVLLGIIPARDPGLIVGATHRLAHVPIPPDLDARLAVDWNVASLNAEALATELPEGGNAIGLYRGGETALLLHPPPGAPDQNPPHLPQAWRNLAPALLQYALLQPQLGIDDQALAGGAAITYEHHLHAALGAVRDGSAEAAFILPAPTLEDVFNTADAGDRMPQKSTYFVPKLPTGLVLHPLT